uniref:Minor structural protein n=3 Tax=Norovirus isolates TaxID=150080 RepID=A0A223PK69_NORV|nr:minor structural protein [Norovirus Hu/JSWXOB1601/CHN]ASU45076.1 minor structural protein [Norovirus Hu/JSWXOB1602/CHN]ASU45079.1 minor structural protein [Norovirus Hu/JSWXOB1603/CHN]
MAGAFVAGLAGDIVTNGIGSLVNAGANAINQKVDFENNKQLQQASFNHDKEMLQAQIQATKQLQADMIALRQGVLTAGGFSPTDAARGAVNAPMTQVLDWNGTRYWAPGAMKTTAFSGGFTSSPNTRTIDLPRKTSNIPAPTPVSRLSSSASTVSTRSTIVSGTSSPSSSTRSSFNPQPTSSSSRTSEWVRSQNRALEPYMRGALQTAYVTPPSSRASSNGTVSTVPKEVLDSWTSVFNTHRQPLFAHLRRRGESQA